MYEKFFGLKKRPFVLTPDPEFLYLSKIHDLALTHLEYGIMNNAGFIAVTGDVGSGKTTLIKYLFEKIKDILDLAMIFNTNLDPQALLELLVKEFELQPPSSKKSDLFDTLADHFIAQYSKGKRCVIIVDEAQNLPFESFEELRMLSNIEIGTDFILQIILVGQPELKERLAHPSLSQLAQRISVYFHISPLPLNEVEDYINHRLRVAGYKGNKPLFEKEAINYIAEFSKGIPRIINLICDTALVYAFADEIHHITLDIVEKAVSDNELLVSLTHEKEEKSEQKLDIKEGDKNTIPESTPESDLISDIKDAYLKLFGRIEAVEMRLKAIEDLEKDRISEVLYDMLKKERERNIELEKEVLLLKEELKEFEAEVYKLEKRESKQKKKIKKSRKIWEVFSLGKEKA